MSHWVRLWDEMPNDPKWRVIARASGRPVSEVIAVFVHMMIAAGKKETWGRLGSWNDQVIAVAIEADPAHVRSIREAMTGLVLEGESLTGWGNRQSLDSSTARTRRYRQRKSESSQTAPSSQRSSSSEQPYDKTDLSRWRQVRS